MGAPMDGFSEKDWILFGVAAYVAVVSLVRLMARHRARVSTQLAAQVERERQAKAAEAKRLKDEEKTKERQTNAA
jgi:hypothetical protein